MFNTVDNEGEVNCISSIYVDNALIGAPDDVAEKIIAKIAEGFPIKDLGIAKHIVGIPDYTFPAVEVIGWKCMVG